MILALWQELLHEQTSLTCHFGSDSFFHFSLCVAIKCMVFCSTLLKICNVIPTVLSKYRAKEFCISVWGFSQTQQPQLPAFVPVIKEMVAGKTPDAQNIKCTTSLSSIHLEFLHTEVEQRTEKEKKNTMLPKHLSLLLSRTRSCIQEMSQPTVEDPTFKSHWQTAVHQVLDVV